MAIIAQTPRLIIRELLPSDEENFIALLVDRLVTAYIPNRTREENSTIFWDTQTDYNNGIRFNRWGVFNKDTGEYIGMGMLKSPDNEAHRAELGYVIHDKYKAQGIASELSNALLSYGFAENNLTEVFAVTDKANTPSQKVLLKNGLAPGDDLFRNGMWLAYFKITRQHWLARQAV